MTRRNTQLPRIIHLLNERDYIDRRTCIDNKISERLSARVQDLEAIGAGKTHAELREEARPW
jgi:hypothetical protein